MKPHDQTTSRCWSMSDPDGRATWEWVDIEGEPGIRWRRFGTHGIYSTP